MVATPGSSGSARGSGARALTYRDRMVKAHDKFWVEVDKAEPILKDLEDELSQSHLTVMGHFLRMRESRDFSHEEAKLMIERMAEIRKDIVNIDAVGEYRYQWRTLPETGTSAIILPITDVAHAMYEEHKDFFVQRATSLEGIPTLENCTADTFELESQLNNYWKSRNRGDSVFHENIHVILRDFAEEVRRQLQVLEGEIRSADKNMADAESHDWKGYIVDDVTQADKPTSLYSIGTMIQKDINGLRDRHVNLNLIKFRTHIEGIDHTTAKQSRRSAKSAEVTATFEETMQPIKQHDKTISDAIQRKGRDQDSDHSIGRTAGQIDGGSQRSIQHLGPRC